jgi:Nif-specific regulatory protein
MASTPDPSAFEEFQELVKRLDTPVTDAEKRELLTRERGHESRIASLERNKARMLLLLDLARGLHRVEHVEELFDLVLGSALDIADADRAYLLKKDVDGTLQVVASRGREGFPAPADDLQELSQTILERVLEGGESLLVGDALNDPHLMHQRSVKRLSLKQIGAFPLPGPSGVVGALYVDSNSTERLLEPEERAQQIQILEAFSAQAALAIEAAAHREALVERAEALSLANRSLQESLSERSGFDRILGRSAAMLPVFRILERVAHTKDIVLVQGETGTGKELVARAIHSNGPRKEGYFIAVNCGAIPKHLIESELFGYRKGTFTGADQDRVGLVEAAHGGTLFLDEIGELPHDAQATLLRFLQDGEVRRLGDTTVRHFDARVIAATNRDLEAEVKAERFRRDLFYRINSIAIELPPLRERGDDIPLLAECFLEKVREERGRPGLRFSRSALRLVAGYSWPGNVRQLMHAVERAGALAPTDDIQPEDLLPRLDGPAGPPPTTGTLREVLRASERMAIVEALRQTGGNVSQAARVLGVSRQHLHARMRLLGIERPHR